MEAPRWSVPVSIVVSGFVIAAALWQHSEKNRYAITAVAFAGNLASAPFLCDTKSGKVWRFYQNDKESGFTLILDPEQK